MLAGFVLVLDRIPSRQPRRRHLVIQRNHRIGQEIEQGFQTLVEERQPVFHTRMFAPRTHGLIQGIIGACRAKFDAIVLPEPGDRRLIQNNL